MWSMRHRIGGFKCLYCLTKKELGHHTNYRNNYRSHHIIDKMLEILAEVIEKPILIETESSQAISLEVDDCINVSMSSKLDLHVQSGNTYFV